MPNNNRKEDKIIKNEDEIQIVGKNSKWRKKKFKTKKKIQHDEKNKEVCV